MKKNDYAFIFLIVFIFFGIIIAVQFRSTYAANTQKASAVQKFEELKGMLKEEIEREEALKREIEKYEKEREALLNMAVIMNDDTNLRRLMKERDEVKLKAGLTDVKGPGVIVKLDDAPGKISEFFSNDDIIIHNMDIVRVINVLNKAGAQAIAVDGERIISTSEIICAGTQIKINDRRYPVPYEIKAIGDPDVLERSLYESDIISIMLLYGLRVEITKSKEIIIPKYYVQDINKLISGLEVVGQ